MKKDKVKDFYFHKAKREKYSARSVYKLKNIQERYHLVAKGGTALDLGAAPGSWTEYLIELLGKNGELWAVDERPLSLTAKDRAHNMGLRFHFLEQSILDPLPAEMPEVDVVVSDVAPFTQGSKLVDSARSVELVACAYKIAESKLKIGGHFVVKLFQSPESIELSKVWAKNFKFSKLYKPPSTHKDSKEIYFVGRHREA